MCHSVHNRPRGYWFTTHPFYGAVGRHPTGMLSHFLFVFLLDSIRNSLAFPDTKGVSLPGSSLCLSNSDPLWQAESNSPPPFCLSRESWLSWTRENRLHKVTVLLLFTIFTPVWIKICQILKILHRKTITQSGRTSLMQFRHQPGNEAEKGGKKITMILKKKIHRSQKQ